ncbi:conserved repeat protein [Shewanella psychrophila]|uniref:Conserved repeat protein n=2 Tax=Shewanella psychrophila TaxID=225848 RepID=A0A1S6HSJ1_9GAMM|nr:conserved repeat protein [Shewanella psychrophila]
MPTQACASESISINLISNHKVYDNEQMLSYDLVITNNGGKLVKGLSVTAGLLDIKALDKDGKLVNAFTSMSVEATATLGSQVGDFNPHGNLTAKEVVLTEGGMVTYHIEAKVSPAVAKEIEVAAQLASSFLSLESNLVSIPRALYQLEISKSADSLLYSPGGQVSFTIKVSNTGQWKIRNALVEDKLSGITAEDMLGNTVAAFSSIDSITATTQGKGSSGGTFDAHGPDLQAKDVVIAKAGWVEYRITATVSDTLVGDILNYAEITAHDELQRSNLILIKPAEANVVITKQVSPTADYQVGDTLNYTVKVDNTGLGIAHHYRIKDSIGAIVVELANNGLSEYQQQNIAGSPFKTWQIEVQQLGDHSASELMTSGGTSVDEDLNDLISLYPNESVTYTISAISKAVAISDIENIASATSDTGDKKTASTTVTALNTITDFTAHKSPDGTEYMPGDWVSYSIEVSNTNATQFADNIRIVDKLSTCTTTELVDGSTGAAFEKWKLSVKRVEEEGSDPGSFLFGAEQTGDIDLVLDLAPKGKVVYRLDALVNPQAIGTIMDNPSCDDTVPEDGSGINMPDGKVEVKKLVDQREFSPSSDLTYTITIKNSGKGYLHNVPVVDALSTITADGVTGSAFTTWTITPSVTDSSGAISTKSNPDIDASIKRDRDLNTHANVFPGDTITYTIVATTKNTISGIVRNKVTVDGNAYSDVGAEPFKYDLSVSKTVDKIHYSEGDDSLRYTIEISNADIAGYAKDIPIFDDIVNIEAELLHEKGTMAPAFESWTITAFTDARPNQDTGIPTSGLKDVNLDTRFSLAAGGKLTYVIEAKIPPRTQDHIVWGRIINKVTLDNTETSSAETGYRLPNIVVDKQVSKTNYQPGDHVSYTITVKNIGAGYANNTDVKDDIAALGLFDKWTVVAESHGIGTRIVGKKIQNNQNIDTKVDIAPGGKIVFIIAGVVVNNIDGQVTNTVKVHEPLDNRDSESSADIFPITDPDKPSVDIHKESSPLHYVPGKVQTYTITVRNNTDTVIENLRVFDEMSTIESTLANNKNNQFADIQGSPFESWTIKSTTKTLARNSTSADLDEVITLQPNTSKVYTIEAIIKDNVVDETVTNRVCLFRHNGDDAGCASAENHRAASGGDVMREVSPAQYKPGDTITYKITASSHTGYYNNIHIQDELENLSVDLIDKEGKHTQGHPFNGQFSVAVSKTSLNGEGTTDGTLDGQVEGNKNLDTWIDVGPGDKVVYTITGVVRDDAAGDITNGDLVVKPFQPNWDYSKESDNKNYQAGQPLIYRLSIKNTGKGHALGIKVQDLLSQVMVDDIKGRSVKAYQIWSFTKIKEKPIAANPSTGAKPEFEKYYYAGTYSNNTDLDTEINLPIGGEIVYTVNAKVIDRAEGEITNVLKVSNDSTSVSHSQSTENYKVSKQVIGYYDAEHNKLSGEGYTPGGYVGYKIRVESSGKGNIKLLKLVDDLAGVKATWFDGSTGSAFESWTIQARTDGGPVSHYGVFSASENIDTPVDIGVDGYVEYYISAKINQEVVGEFHNSVTAGRTTKTSEVSVMQGAKFTLTKQAFSDAQFTSPKSDYRPEDEVFYKIKLENKGWGTLYDVHVKDLLKHIKSQIAEDTIPAGSSPKAQPFREWQVAARYTAGRVTNIGSFIDGSKVDIDTDFDLAPNDAIEFSVEAKLDYGVLGEVKNSVTASGQTKAAKLKAQVKDISYSKVITSIGGRPYQANSHYRPGDELVYTIKIHNKHNAWANDVAIKDKIGDISTLLAGGSRGQAFSRWHVEYETTAGSDGRVDTQLPTNSADTDIDFITDIGPLDEITIRIIVTIKDTATGDIDSNHLVVDGKTDTTDTIPPFAPKLTYGKEVIKTSADGSSKTEYAPKGEVQYRVWVSNSGEGFAHDVIITDPIDKIVSADGQTAFSLWAVELESTPGLSVVSGDISGNVPLNAHADIAPGETLAFIVSGKVAGDVTGLVRNRLFANDVDVAHVDLNPGVMSITSSKHTDTPNYTPGSEVRFQIEITNTSDSIAIVAVEDDLNAIMVMTANGTMEPALTDIVMSARVVGDKINSTIPASLGTPDQLNSEVRIAARDSSTTPVNTSIIFDISAKVVENAVGEFTNTARIDGKDFELIEGNIKPLPAKITLDEHPIKTPAVYAPGESIGFEVIIKNIGSGYALNTQLANLLDKTRAWAAGSTDKVRVFDKWDRVTVTSSSSLSTIIAGKELNNSEGYFNEFNIHPGDSVTLQLFGTVKEEILGDIDNMSQVTQGNNIYMDDAIYTPVEGQLLILKTADNPTYLPGSMVGYNIKLENRGDGWLNDVKLSDLLSDIDTELAGAVTDKAFAPSSLVLDSVVSIPVVPGELGEIKAEGNKLIGTADIAPHQIINIHFSAKVKDTALGEIVNVAKANELSSEIAIVPQVAEVKLTKTVHKPNYMPGELITYTVTVANSSQTWANDVELVDDLAGIMTEEAGGAMVNAFVPGTLTATHTSTAELVKMQVKDNRLNATLDIAPMSEVSFILEAKLQDTILGEVTNSAEVGDQTATAVIIPQAAPKVQITKLANNPIYLPGELVTYTVTVKNSGDTWTNDVQVSDDIGEITTEHASGVTSAAFVEDSLSVTSDSKPNLIEMKILDNKLTAQVDIAPKSEVKFTIHATLNSTVLGEIINIAFADGNAAEAKMTPVLSEVEIEKTVNHVRYTPGGMVTYRVTVSNETEAWANDVSILDDMSGITTLLAGGIQGLAFVPDSMAVEHDGRPALVTMSAADNKLQASADIAPMSKLTFTIRALLVDTVLGQITNQASADGKTSDVAITPVANPILSLSKTVSKPTYLVDEDVVYTVTLINAGDAWAHDVQLEDDLNVITTELAGGEMETPFVDASLVVSHTSKPELIELNNEPNKLSARLDIAPHSQVVFTLTAKMKSSVLGEVTNTVTAGDQTAGVSILPEDVELIFTKSVDKENYFPGDLLTYTLVVENRGSGWANDVQVQDAIAGINTSLAGGLEGQAFVPGTLEVTHDSCDELVQMTIDGDVLVANADIAPKSTLIFVIKAQLKDTALGEVLNEASANDINDVALSIPSKASVTLKKTVESPVYQDGGKVTYHLTLTNQTDAFAHQLSLKDTLNEIKVMTIDGVEARAFSSWESRYQSGDSNTSVVSQSRLRSDGAKNTNIEAMIDLAPRDTLVFTIDALVRDDAVGEISNTADLNFDGVHQQSNVIIEPDVAVLESEKVSVETEYVPGETLNFTLTMKNTSNNYIFDTLVSDDMSTIQVEYADSTLGSAFVPGSLSFTPSQVGQASSAKPISDSEYEVDVAPGREIIFNVSGIVSENAVGDIQNIALVDGSDIESNLVPTAVAHVVGELFTRAEYYVPGEPVEYHLVLRNDGLGVAKDVYLLTRFAQSTGTWIEQEKGLAFDSWTISATTSGNNTTSGEFTDNKDIATKLNISPGGSVDFTITTTVDQDMLSNIDVYGFFLDSTYHKGVKVRQNIEGVGDADRLSSLNLPPVGAKMVVDKTVEKASYIDSDTQVIYHLSAVNIGEGNAPLVTLFDDIAGLSSPKGIDVFTDWRIAGTEYEGSSVVDQFTLKGDQLNKQNLNIQRNFKSKSRNRIELVISATIANHLDDDVTNILVVTEQNGTVTQDEATTHIKKIPDNQGELKITKQASKNTAQVGDVIEYEIILDNDNESYFKDVAVFDKLPAGFRYQLDTTEMTLSGIDGKFDTQDDVSLIKQPTLSGQLRFANVDFEPFEKLRIRYLLKVSVGVTFGKYINTAQAKIKGVSVSELATAMVEIQADKLFDTASIIGKVFEDINGDGYQADAGAFDIKVLADLPIGIYVADSTRLKLMDKFESVKDISVGDLDKTSDDSSAKVLSSIQSGIEIDKLMGQSRNRTLDESHLTVIRFQTTTPDSFPLILTSGEGTRIEFSSLGEVTRNLSGDVKSGLSAEVINVTRNLYRVKALEPRYLWEIIIDNIGVYEDGIPGARLITTEGIKIETDEFGRYHVPDQWVTDKTGRNFLVKLDSDSLPTGMKVISENPKVKRISSNGLAKFNFSVQTATLKATAAPDSMALATKSQHTD